MALLRSYEENNPNQQGRGNILATGTALL
jgi:hypothetical protein